MDRSIKTHQDKLRMLFITLTSTGTPKVTGIDANQVKSVVDNGVGDITIIFKKPFVQKCELAGHAVVGATPLMVIQEASDFDRITVNLLAFDTGAFVAADGVVNLTIVGKDSKFNR